MDNTTTVDDGVDTDTPRTFSYAAGARVLIGLAGIGGLGYQYNRAQHDLHTVQHLNATSDVQLVQLFWTLWVPHIFYSILIIGVVMSLYIISRYAD